MDHIFDKWLLKVLRDNIIERLKKGMKTEKIQA